jgi:transposase-like protein
MSTKNGHQPQHDESFKQAAVEFLNSHGCSLEVAAAELGVDPAELRMWKRKWGARSRPVKSMSGMARLRAENEALRNQIVSLQSQWDTLKTTLGMLSTTVCSHETA